MTLYNSPYIACDWRGCYFKSDDLSFYLGIKATQIRTELTKRGWTRVLGKDFCDHHPDLPEHKPTLKTVTESWISGVRAHCSCGWVDEYPRPSQRSHATQRWVHHLPEEGFDACMRILHQLRGL